MINSRSDETEFLHGSEIRLDNNCILILLHLVALFFEIISINKYKKKLSVKEFSLKKKKNMLYRKKIIKLGYEICTR